MTSDKPITTKTEQLISMLENYGDVLDQTDNIDDVILYVSEKITEANGVTCNKGYGYYIDHNYTDDDF